MSGLSRLGRFDPRGWPVRARIAAVSAVLTFLILLSFALVVGRLAANKLDANFRSEAQSTVNELANRIEVTFGADGLPQAVERGSSIEEFVPPSGGRARLVRADGQPFRPETGIPYVGPVSTDETQNVGELTVASQQVLGTPPFGPAVFVQYVRERDSLEATTDRLWLFLGGGVLAGTILAALAGLAVAQRAMNPIAALTSAAREVATTRDPSRRLPEPRADDEVAELTRTLDEMLRALDAARSESEQMVQAQREFIADASHELRTPLTSILANLELLEARLAERAGNREDAEIVAGALGSSQRMRRLVSDLLLLARADAGRGGPRAACDLAEIADAAVAEIRVVSGTHSLALEAEEPVMVVGNPDDLHRLVANLLENAVRHTPPGTNVVATVGRDADLAIVAVADDGPGLPAGLEDQLFARFVRGNGPSDLSADAGTGLGLAIVKAVALAHGGEVEAGAGADGGARFTVRLPLAAGDEQTLTQAPAAPSQLADQPYDF